MRLQDAINNADSIVIGAGAGLSTAAGFIYTGERFEQHFSDFIDKYHFRNMTAENPEAIYACINYDEIVCPDEIKEQTIALTGDAGDIIYDFVHN